MRAIVETTAFRRDLKRAKKRGKDLAKLREIVRKLVLDIPLEARHRPHPLVGSWRPKWECHLEPDWLLVYEVKEAEVVLVRTGTHADLFEK